MDKFMKKKIASRDMFFFKEMQKTYMGTVNFWGCVLLACGTVVGAVIMIPRVYREGLEPAHPVRKNFTVRRREDFPNPDPKFFN